MKKKLNIDTITNELTESAFFSRNRQQTEEPKPAPSPAPLPHKPAPEHQPDTFVRTNARTPVRRAITRYAFEFYQDQIESLRTMSLAEKQRGEKGSMSEMVREALDMYIAKRKANDR